MLANKLAEMMTGQPRSTTKCAHCKEPAEIVMIGYGNGGDCDLCGDCAMQLARMLLEDLCELRTAGGRHG